MLVRECAPGDMVETIGWDIAIAITHASTAHQVGLKTAYLIPARLEDYPPSTPLMSINIAKKRTMLYVGPVFTKGTGRSKKVHHFLTDQGDSIGLHGSEFKYINPCKS